MILTEHLFSQETSRGHLQVGEGNRGRIDLVEADLGWRQILRVKVSGGGLRDLL